MHHTVSSRGHFARRRIRFPRTGLHWLARIGSLLSGRLIWAADRFFQPVPLARDRFDRRFLLALVAVLAFTLVAYWSLTDYWDVGWFAGEDGVSEWWSVATFLAAAVFAVLAGRGLIQTGHARIGWLHVTLAVVFIVAALEEISWGQRIFGWSTPETLAEINEQGETTLHNVPSFDRVLPTIIFWGGTVALVAALARAVLHRQRRITTADFILPSLVLAPALLMIMFWIGAGQDFPGNLPRMILTHYGLDPVGSEIPEVLTGLCLCLYTYTNFRRSRALKRAIAAEAEVSQRTPATFSHSP